MDGAPLSIADVMVKNPPTILGSATVGAAIDLLREHNLPALPVADDGRLIGLVAPMHLVQQPLDRIVSEVMMRDVVPAAPSLMPAQAEALFALQHVDALPVTQDSRVVGILSLPALLEAAGPSTDPLTSLPWGAALRTWAGAALLRGREVAIAFVDLDNCRVLNETLGPVAADAVLRTLAQVLRGLVDPAQDMLCRLRSDDFAIATLRSSVGVELLTHRIHDIARFSVRMRGARLRVATNIGVAGGRRRKVRAPQAAAATVDDLLTLAERAAAHAKAVRKGAVRHGGGLREPAPRRAGGGLHLAVTRLRLVQVAIQDEAHGSLCSIELGVQERSVVGTAFGRFHGRGLGVLAAEASLQALGQLMGEAYAFTLKDLAEVPCAAGTLAAVVLARAIDSSEQFVGAACASDLPHAVARATLDAVNRRVSDMLRGTR